MISPLVSIILPIHNQASQILSILESYERLLRNSFIDYEIILIVNACTDDTLEVCQNLQKQSRAIRVVQTERRGWGHAVKLGLGEAAGDFICYTNSARTQAQDLLLLIHQAVANPTAVVKASRKVRDSILRVSGSLLYNIECRLLFGLSNWDINGTPKVFPRKFDKLLQLTRDDDLIDLEFSYLCKKYHYPILEIPVYSSSRHGGRSTTNLNSARKMYLGALAMRYSSPTQASHE